MKIILCGAPQTGKTTVGRALALRMACPFYDSDEALVERARIESGQDRSVRRIFLEEGELKARIWEEDAIAALLKEAPGVLSLGGASLESEKTRRLIMKQKSFILYLRASESLLWERISTQESLPSYLRTAEPRETLAGLLSRRKLHYEALSDAIVDVDAKTIDVLIDEIIELLGVNYGK